MKVVESFRIEAALQSAGSACDLQKLPSLQSRTGNHSKSRGHNEDVEVACEEYPDFCSRTNIEFFRSKNVTFMIFCYRRSSMVFCRGDGRRDELVFWVWFGDLGNDLVSSVCFGQLGYQ